jgi:hypothetical protein
MRAIGRKWECGLKMRICKKKKSIMRAIGRKGNVHATKERETERENPKHCIFYGPHCSSSTHISCLKSEASN